MNRAQIWGEYIARTGATVRATAEVFSVSKSTVHKEVTGRLEAYDPLLAARVRNVLNLNREQRHLRGGEATRKKYLDIKKHCENDIKTV